MNNLSLLISIVAVFSLIIISLMEYEYWPPLVVFIAAVTCGYVYLNGWAQVWNFVQAAPLYVVLYVIAGAVWSVIKWWLHLRKARQWVRDNKNDTSVLYPPVGLFGKYVNQFVRDRVNELERVRSKDKTLLEKNNNIIRGLVSYDDLNISYFTPYVGDFKARIISWMFLWPWSLVWTFCRDVVVEIGTIIFNRLKSVYHRIAVSVFQ